MNTGEQVEAARKRLAASLSEGFCPDGHRLSHGGGTWGTCYMCGVIWTLWDGGYDTRSVPSNGECILHTADGRDILFEDYL